MSQSTQTAVTETGQLTNNKTLFLTVLEAGSPRMGHQHGGLDDKEFTCYAGDLGSIPGWGRSTGEENGNPLQYSCLEKSMDRRVWWAPVHEVAKNLT